MHGIKFKKLSKIRREKNGEEEKNVDENSGDVDDGEEHHTAHLGNIKLIRNERS